MATNAIRVVERESGNCEPSKTKKRSIPIRLCIRTKADLDKLVAKANKKKFGRKVKPDDIVSFALSLLDDTHLDAIRDKTISNKDRLEMLFAQLSKEKRNLTKDEMLGLLLKGEHLSNQE